MPHETGRLGAGGRLRPIHAADQSRARADRPACDAQAAGFLHRIFEEQVDRGAGDQALICGKVSLTYRELETRANRLAHRLRSLGVGPGEFVALLLDRSELSIVGILAVLKAGAAYVPLEPSHPDDRLRHIVEEISPQALLTESIYRDKADALFDGKIIFLDSEVAETSSHPSTRIAPSDVGLAPSDLCYVIYTSGTTGRPKGVMAEHRNVWHFVAAFNEVCVTTQEDRVFQGFSLTFDGSVEEIWMAFSNGATLVVPPRDAPRFGNELACSLSHWQVTYLSTVPTMLSTMTQDIATLRQLVVSGETCTPELVARWAKPGRRMLNVYGPTEATVNSTVSICKPGVAITIGRPLPGYEVLLLDEYMRSVPPGRQGELFIAGDAIARGYFRQPEFTCRNFVRPPGDGRRFYRTGDLARIDVQGDIEFVGRIDGQVKVRGYRVELSEIETVLCEHPNVAAAAATLCDGADPAFLAAYVALRDRSAPIDRADLLARLKRSLPVYMVPTHLDVVDSFPVLTSGKLDRKRLPAPLCPLIDETGTDDAPADDTEATIAAVWAEAFALPRVGVNQNFFLDLGGHSLLAARMTSLLRGYDARVAVRDVYAFPTVRSLAAHLRKSTQATPLASPEYYPPARERVPRSASVGASMLQASCIAGLWIVLSAPLIVLLPIGDELLRNGSISFWSASQVALLAAAIPPAMMLAAIGGKWLIVGRYRPGAYPLWSGYYLRWWVVGLIQGLSGASLLVGTPLMPIYYRLMGAKVGRGCYIGTAHCSIFDLVSIGDDTSIGGDTQLSGYRIEDGHLLIGGVAIGDGCFIGSHSALGLDVKMESGARLDDQSLLPDGVVMPAGAQWRGSPPQPAEVPVAGRGDRRATTPRLVGFTIAALGLSYLVALLLALPGLAIVWLWATAFREGWIAPCLAATAGALPLLVVFGCVWIALAKALVFRRAAPGVRDLYGLYYLRYWLASGLMRASRELLRPLFTTLYLPPWMRLLGAQVGANCEMSTIWSFMPELLTAAEGSFFADGCMLGGPRMYGGRFEIRRSAVGYRSFVGNGAMLPTGASLGDDCLLGVLSTPPVGVPRTPDGSDWLGSPGFHLPRRQKVGGFDETTTFRPTAGLYMQRMAIDALRILIPAYTALCLGLGTISALLYVYETYGLPIALGVSPLLLAATMGSAVAIVTALKWGVMGRYHPVVVPLWCRYVWLNEMINGAYETIMAPIVAAFFGTPFAAPLLRLLGCRIGRHCYIGTSLFSEFDLVDVGDHVALNSGSVIQNHLFEDRIMKSSYLRIDDQCSIGNMSVVLYDTRMQEGAVLGPLSLLMKGETIPACSRWHGIPTVNEVRHNSTP
jgi:non-ribosomal peptide synthetase-like protein